MRKNKIKIISGWRLYFIYFSFSSVKYLLNRKKYKLLFTEPLFKRIVNNYKVRNKLLLTKAIKFNGMIYSTLTVPAYPSKVYDRLIEKGGLNFSSVGTDKKRYNDYVLLAVTNECRFNCLHCYEKHNLNKPEIIPIKKLMEVIKQLQDYGTGIIVLTGGEPLLRFEDIINILRTSDKDKSDFHIHTSGFSLTKDKVVELKKEGLMAAGIGLDDFNPERNDFLRGTPGSFKNAVNALRLFNEEGIFTYINACLSKQFVNSGDLWKFLEMAKELNVGLIHLIEPRPCGGYNGAEIEDLYGYKERDYVVEFIKTANISKRYKKYPLVYSTNFIEDPARMGCMMGGLSHFHIDSAGNVNPCVFLPVSFGNILKEDFYQIYNRMRKAVPFPLRKECPSVTLLKMTKDKSDIFPEFPVPVEKIKKEWEKLFV